MAGIKDVARASGVSPATVSQALGGGTRPVSEETRKRIQLAARALGYRPNAIARGLVKKRMNTFGVIIQHELESSHTNPALGAILEGILTIGTRQHQQVTLIMYRTWDDAHDALSTVCDGRCDGVLLTVPPDNIRLVDGLIERGLPFVLIGAHHEDPCISTVDVDHVSAAETAVQYLLGQGHQRIVFMSDVLGQHGFNKDRLLGYCRALAAAGLTVDPSLQILRSVDSISLLRLMSAPVDVRPTAVFCSTDTCALRTLQDIKGMGLNVPEDLSIIGFDDIPTAALTVPGLTTVHQPMAALGERAAEILLSQIDGRQTKPQKLYLPTELAIRGTVCSFSI